MALYPRVHREFRIKGDPDNLSHDLVSELPRHHISVGQHYPGSRICGSIRRTLSPSGGQILRIDFHPIDGGEVEMVVESKFRFPGVDFAGENEKNVDLVEDLLRHTVQAPAAA